MADLKSALSHQVPERTLRRWLEKLVVSGHIIALGEYKGRRYQLAENDLAVFSVMKHHRFWLIQKQTVFL